MLGCTCVGDTVGTTLSIHADGKGVRSGSRSEPVLVLALEPAGSVGRARFELRRASLVLEEELS
mgnify:CR=1 FL=1